MTEARQGLRNLIETRRNAGTTKTRHQPGALVKMGNETILAFAAFEQRSNPVLHPGDCSIGGEAG